jgi:hypothetical protein
MQNPNLKTGIDKYTLMGASVVHPVAYADAHR